MKGLSTAPGLPSVVTVISGGAHHASRGIQGYLSSTHQNKSDLVEAEGEEPG